MLTVRCVETLNPPCVGPFGLMLCTLNFYTYDYAAQKNFISKYVSGAYRRRETWSHAYGSAPAYPRARSVRHGIGSGIQKCYGKAVL